MDERVDIPLSNGNERSRRAGFPPPSPRPILPYSQNPFTIDRAGMLPSPGSSIPPIPTYSQIPATCQPIGPRLSRSLSQPSPVYSLDGLLMSSQLPESFHDSPSAQVENKDSGGFKYPSLPPTPHRKSHRRAISDHFPFEFDKIMAQNCRRSMYPKPFEVVVGESEPKEGVGQRKAEEVDLLSAFTNLDTSNSDGSKRLKRRGGKDIAAPSSIHYSRSASVDSLLETVKLSHSSSGDSHYLTDYAEVGHKLTKSEMKKIADMGKLAELATVNPKRVIRILKNRESAQRSKERKAQYLSDLENEVETLETKNAALSAQLVIVQRDKEVLMGQKRELEMRLEGMENLVQYHNKLIEHLNGEVESLKVAATGEMSSHRAR